MKKALRILGRTAGTLALPLIMYFAMMLLCYRHGKMYYGTWRMWQTLLVDIGLSISCALGIGLQFKCGRFDFSGGAIMLLSLIVAGNVAQDNGNSIALLVVLCALLCVALSLVVALFYVVFRVPIVITTIGYVLLYEALTCLVYGGTGVNLVSNMKLRLFSTYPYALIPLAVAIAVYALFSYTTVAGKRAELLAHSQEAAVHIGVKEERNAIVSFIFSGLIFGCAALIYSAKGLHNASFSSMATVGQLFTNIMPVFIGLMVGIFCGDTLGTIVGSVTLCLMNYALTAVFSSERGTAISLICTAAFILLINVVSAQGQRLVALLKRGARKKGEIV